MTDARAATRFARRVFRIAAIYGLLVLLGTLFVAAYVRISREGS